MNYFHLEAKVVSRGAGRSAIAAAAYASCSRLYNDYDGLTHDYTRKHPRSESQLIRWAAVVFGGRSRKFCGVVQTVLS